MCVCVCLKKWTFIFIAFVRCRKETVHKSWNKVHKVYLKKRVIDDLLVLWNTASDVAAIISHINRHFRLAYVFYMVKPKLVTQPAIMHSFFVTPPFKLQIQTTLIGQQSDDNQPIKLTHAFHIRGDFGSWLEKYSAEFWSYCWLHSFEE